MVAVPSLQSICVEVTAGHDFWLVQKRHVQYLPEHVANQLLQQLLQRGRLQEPKQLGSFQHCATRLTLTGRQLGAAQQLAEWLAYIAGLRHLTHLSLAHVPRLKDKHLTPLTRLAGSLVSLQLTGCSSITKAACPLVLGQLTNLEDLRLSGTGIRPPCLQHLSRLTALTTLDLGGCQVSDAELASSLAAFTRMQRLFLWGCTAGDASVPLLAQLPHLRQLDMSWSLLAAAIPAVSCSSLTQLDLSHCKLDGSWEDAATAAAVVASSGAAAGATQIGTFRLRELRLVAAAVSAGMCEVLEAVIRSSSDTLQILDVTSLSTDSVLPLLLALQTTPSLTALSLASTRLPDDFLPTLLPYTALQTLDLSQNPEVTDAGLQATLLWMQQLQQLNLAGTGVGDAVLVLLGQLPMLRELVLAGTSVTWEPEWVAGSAAIQQQDQQQQDQVQRSVAGAGSSMPGSVAGGSPAGQLLWQELRVLDLSDTHVTDAGCQQLARQLAAAAAAAAAGTCTSEQNESGMPASGGLRKLMIGSSTGSGAQLGKQGLAALAHIGSLQQLTLQRWQLQEHDLAALQPLQQLQQLHTAQLDPWLLSDAALINLAAAAGGSAQHAVLPNLQLITRDGRVLLPAAVGGAEQQVHGGALLEQASAAAAGGSLSWLSAAAAASRATAASELQGTGTQDNWSAAASSYSSEDAALVPSLATAAHAHAPAGAGTSSGGRRRKHLAAASSSRASTSVHARLSEYDERYRYTTEQLIGLRGAASAAGSAAAGLAGMLGELGIGSADGWRRTSE